MEELKVIENELVPVYETSTGEKVVYGSELHEVLEVNTKFSDWIKRRLEDCESMENENYEVLLKNEKNLKGGRPQTEYIIKIDTAKEMAMLERNEKGKQVRRYFIQVEKKYKEQKATSEQLSPELQMFKKIFDAVARQELQQKEQAQKIKEVADRVESIREVVAINTTSWRDETGKILRRIGLGQGGGDAYSRIRTECYALVEKRMGVNLQQRLINKRRRMADEGVSKTTRYKLSYVDIIAEDKKLIEGYMAIVKEMAIKYSVLER